MNERMAILVGKQYFAYKKCSALFVLHFLYSLEVFLSTNSFCLKFSSHFTAAFGVFGLAWTTNLFRFHISEVIRNS